jgi:hypothetical protein
MAYSIRTFVFERAAKSFPYAIWREAQERFPHRIVSFGYVQRLCKEAAAQR